jgi:hypothetical protein
VKWGLTPAPSKVGRPVMHDEVGEAPISRAGRAVLGAPSRPPTWKLRFTSGAPALGKGRVSSFDAVSPWVEPSLCQAPPMVLLPAAQRLPPTTRPRSTVDIAFESNSSASPCGRCE